MIRRLDKGDIKEILALQQRSNFSDGWNENMLLNAFDNRFVALGYFIKDTLVGYIGVDTGLYEYEIESILVDINYRKKGIGKELLSSAIKLAKDNHAESVFLEVRQSNHSAIGLYSSAGFIQISKRKRYYPDGEDALVFKKEI